jgi:hypothetical protein
LTAALVQQPWITPELSMGPPTMAAVAVALAASRTNALTVLMKMVRACSLLIVSSCLSWLIREATHGRMWPVGCGPGLIGGGGGLGRG